MSANVLYKGTPRFSAWPGCPMCAGKGEFYNPENEAMVLCFCREHGKPPRAEYLSHCVRCVAESGGLREIGRASCRERV